MSTPFIGYKQDLVMRMVKRVHVVGFAQDASAKFVHDLFAKVLEGARLISIETWNEDTWNNEEQHQYRPGVVLKFEEETADDNSII